MFSFEGWRLLLWLGRHLWRPKDREIVVQKNLIFFSCKFFSHFLVIKTLDPDPNLYSASNAGSGSVSNEYGSETLHISPQNFAEAGWLFSLPVPESPGTRIWIWLRISYPRTRYPWFYDAKVIWEGLARCIYVRVQNSPFRSQCCGSTKVSMRIPVQHFRSIRIRMRFRIQGLDDKKLEKMYNGIFLKFKLQLTYL